MANRNISFTTDGLVSLDTIGSPIVFNGTPEPTSATLVVTQVNGQFGLGVVLDNPAGGSGVKVTIISSVSTDFFDPTLELITKGSGACTVMIPTGDTGAYFNYFFDEKIFGARSIIILTDPILTYIASPLVYYVQIPPSTATLMGPISGGISEQSSLFTVTFDQPANGFVNNINLKSSNSNDIFKDINGNIVTSINIPIGANKISFYMVPGN